MNSSSEKLSLLDKEERDKYLNLHSKARISGEDIFRSL